MRRTPAFSIHVLAPGDVTAMRALLATSGEAFDERETYGAEPPRTAYLDRGQDCRQRRYAPSGSAGAAAAEARSLGINGMLG